jgi:hypothetical protein
MILKHITSTSLNTLNHMTWNIQQWQLEGHQELTKTDSWISGCQYAECFERQ